MSFYTSGQDKADASSGIDMAQLLSRWEEAGSREEGSVRAQNTKTGGIVALKRMRMEREKDAIPVSELQEMTILLGLENES